MSPKKFPKTLHRLQFFRGTDPNQGECSMNREFQKYRFARIEAQNITRARLEAQFKDGIGDFEEAIARLVTTEPPCTPWRDSELERAGCRDGTRIAALEFYWAHRGQGVIGPISC
jgi:hypothetical protein